METDRLVTQIEQLKSIPTHKFIGKLGSGLWLVETGSAPDLIIVEQGFIEYRRQGKSRFFQDPTFKIERQLLQSGKDTLKAGDEHYDLIQSASTPLFTSPKRK